MQLYIRSFVVTLLLLFSSQARSTEHLPVLVIKIKDSINLSIQEQLDRTLRESAKINAVAVLLEIDTPGGFLEVTRSIVQKMLQSEVPIAVWVTPGGARAAPAGSMITMAAHYAAMSPSTSIGAATPVTGDGNDVGESMKNKITNDTVSFVEGIAQKRNRNAEWAKKSVTEAASLTAPEAFKLQVIDGIHSTREEVYAGLQKKFVQLPSQVRFVEIERNYKEIALSFLSNPNVAYGLMALGSLGIYVEFSNPGLMIPGIIGVVSLALGAITMQIIPIQPGALALVVVGFILLIIEVFTPLPTFGVAGIMALACFVMGGVFLMDSTQTTLTLDWSLWIPLIIVASLFIGWLSWNTIRALKAKPVAQGMDALIGQEVEVVKVLTQADHFTVKVFGELWKARLEEANAEVAVGTRLTVKRQEGLTLIVSKHS